MENKKITIEEFRKVMEEFFYGNTKVKTEARLPEVTKEGDWYRIDDGGGNCLYTKEGGMKMFDEVMKREGEKLIEEYKKNLDNSK